MPPLDRDHGDCGRTEGYRWSRLICLLLAAIVVTTITTYVQHRIAQGLYRQLEGHEFSRYPWYELRSSYPYDGAGWDTNTGSSSWLMCKDTLRVPCRRG